MVATAMATAAGLLWAAPPASADPNFEYYPPDLGTYHSWCITASVPFGDVRLAMQNAMFYVGTATNVREKRVDCVTSGSGQTDVRFRVSTDPGFPITYGRTWCRDWNSKGLCDRYDALVNKLAIDQNDAITDKYAMYRKTACHEVGHTVTLEHYSGTSWAAGMTRHDCLRKGTMAGTQTYRTYESHHINSHVNAWFCSGCTLADHQFATRDVPSGPGTAASSVNGGH